MSHRLSPNTPLSTRHPAADCLLLFIALGAANWLLQPGDLGWLGLSPTPWLLLPLLLGLRWGFLWGLLGGLLAAAVAFGGALHRGEMLRGFWLAHTYTLTCLPLAGAIAGEVASLVVRRTRRTQSQLAEAEAKLTTLTVERDLLAETRQALQQRLALVGADDWALDERVASLAGAPAEARPAGLLRLLRDTCGVTEAAIYRPVGPSTLELVSSVGAEAPTSLSTAASPLAALALETGRPVTVRYLFANGTADAEETALAALPAGVHGILLVTRMAFESVTARTFARMETILARLG